jgi:hypothetical protein
MMDILDELSYHDPHRHAHIIQLYNDIHGRYRLGYSRDGPEAYHLSHEMEKLSRLLQKSCRRTPWGGHGLDKIASQLRHMGRDPVISPRRRRCRVRVWPQFYDGFFPYGNRVRFY